MTLRLKVAAYRLSEISETPWTLRVSKSHYITDALTLSQGK